MAKMKSRQEFPPGGWLFTQPQIPSWKPPSGSFDTVVRAVIDLRRGNAAITSQNNLSTDYATVETEVDAFNAQRMIKNGWNHFVVDGGNASPTFRPPQRLQQSVAAVGTNLGKTLAGIKIITDWWGDGLKPVEQSTAQRRADICKACPKNQDGNFWQRIEASLSARLKQMIEIKNEMSLKVMGEEQLKSCAVCDCWNATSIWTPLANVTPHVTDKMRAQLQVEAPACWKIKEVS